MDSSPEQPAGGRMRAGDADRDRTIELLHRHRADGRLTPDELAERRARVFGGAGEPGRRR